MRSRAPRLWVALALLLSTSAYADTCDDVENAIRSAGYKLALVRLTPCLGDKDRDVAVLTKKFNDATPDALSAAARYDAALTATQLLQTEVSAHLTTPDPNADLWQRLQDRLVLERIALNKIPPDNFDARGDELFDDKFWSILLPSGDFGTTDGHAANALGPTCADTVMPCPAYDSRKAVIRVVKLGNRLSGYARKENLAAQTADAVLMNDRWDAYFHEGLPQYWWEVWLNGRLMEHQSITDPVNHNKHPLCPVDKATQIQQGFCSVPQMQFIALHPEAGLEWNKDARSSDELKPVFLVEVFGWQRWQFEPGTATMRHRFGASLVAAYGNRRETSDWSYGVMLHAGAGYNLAVTRNSRGDVGLLVNFNLADKYFGRKQVYEDYLQALKKPSIMDVLTGKWPPQLSAP
jgi:hypothetical protein